MSKKRNLPLLLIQMKKRRWFLPALSMSQSMTITNQYGTYTIVPFGDMHGDADTYYTIEGMDINQLDVYSIQNIVKYGCNRFNK